MPALDLFEALFVMTAFLFEGALVVHFAVRRWRFDTAVRQGWVIYVMSVPAVLVSSILLLEGKEWWLWLGGVFFFFWAVFGFTVEYLAEVQWRDPIRWSIFVPYMLLYLGISMSYWWPLARIWPPLWYAIGVLFVVATVLNVASHRAPSDRRRTS
ncbi:hypothetical protein [Lacisediminihabitans sp.]|uniref:hypothetical protein n=1 Tax=Lacisediminihabitans sp. TaxID=2787631 RepID=UPI00374D00FE